MYVQFCLKKPLPKVTYTVSGGALNPTHSLTVEHLPHRLYGRDREVLLLFQTLLLLQLQPLRQKLLLLLQLQLRVQLCLLLLRRYRRLCQHRAAQRVRGVSTLSYTPFTRGSIREAYMKQT